MLSDLLQKCALVIDLQTFNFLTSLPRVENFVVFLKKSNFYKRTYFVDDFCPFICNKSAAVYQQELNSRRKS